MTNNLRDSCGAVRDGSAKPLKTARRGGAGQCGEVDAKPLEDLRDGSAGRSLGILRIPYACAKGDKPPSLRKRKQPVVTEINFLLLPSKGTIYRQDDREFRTIDYEPHVRKFDGQDTFVLTWQGICKSCHKSYLVKSGMKAKWLSPRCDRHRKAGLA